MDSLQTPGSEDEVDYVLDQLTAGLARDYQAVLAAGAILLAGEALDDGELPAITAMAMARWN